MKKLFLALVIVVVAVAGAAAVFAMYMMNRIQEPFKGYAEPERLVEISPGSGAAEIRRRLVDAGIVSDELAFRAALLWTGKSRALKAGEYRFDRPMSVVEVIDKIERGDVYEHPITFPEGLTIREMAAVYQSHGFGTARDFIEAARDGSLVSDLDPVAKDLEGYLFPETYTLPRSTPASKLVSMMVARFRDTYNDLEMKRTGETDSVAQGDRDARVTRGKRDRQGRGETAGRRCLPESSDAQHADAGGPDGCLCPPQSGHL